MLDRPGFDRGRALRAHKELLVAKKRRLEEIIRTVEKTLNALEGGCRMAKEEMFEGFDMAEIEKHQAKYADEVRQKYDPKVVAECERKTAKYTKEDWAAMFPEGTISTAGSRLGWKRGRLTRRCRPPWGNGGNTLRRISTTARRRSSAASGSCMYSTIALPGILTGSGQGWRRLCGRR